MHRTIRPLLSLALLTAVGSAAAWPGEVSPWVFDIPKGGSNCSSLVTVPDDTRYDVSFEGDIRPQLEGVCQTCHLSGSSGGLNMSFNNARVNLIGDSETGAPTFQDTTRLRVKPFAPTESFLFEKINCLNPPYGGRMPPQGGDTILLQKLIHDWIAAGALMPDAPNANRLFIGNFEQIVRPGPAP